MLLPKLPLSEKNIEVFKCARKMLLSCGNGYIERSFIVYTEQMEELTGNTGEWRAYGDLARRISVCTGTSGQRAKAKVNFEKHSYK